MLAYIDGLDPEIKKEPYVREQRALALGKLGRQKDAITELEALIAAAGDTSEREGLVGGRYKELMRDAQNANRMQDADYFRNMAIDRYERGMMLDLNDFFPSSNLPRLYRARGGTNDESRAQTAVQVAGAACERARLHGTADEWVRPTQLGVAFDLGDPDKANGIAEQVEREGADVWKLSTTLASLKESALQARDADAKGRLLAVVERLGRLIAPRP